MKNNEIDFTFDDEDVSRKQCVISFEENNWYLVDGDGIKNSSNGTWFFPEKYYNINDGLIFRIGTTIFQFQNEKLKYLYINKNTNIYNLFYKIFKILKNI